MSWKTLGAICLTLAVAAPVAAQAGQGRQMGNHGPMPAQLLKLQMTLELSADQVEQLEALQTTFSEQRNARMDQARELREQMRSGDVTRNEMREQASAHREAGQEISAAHKRMIQEVLTDEQRGKLAEMREVAQQGQRSRMGMRGQRGRGGQQGVRGRRGYRGRGGQGMRGGMGSNRGGPPLRSGRRGGGRG
jgi:DNA-directed RNA polymerase beta' subunit